jgi:integrase
MAKFSAKNLQTATARARLTPRGKPYEHRLLPGVHLAYRASTRGTGAWIVIAADGKGGRWQSVFAHADDKQEADGVAVLDYEQAANKARALARGDANAAADRPVTIAEAVDAYAIDLAGRGRRPYNAAHVRSHLPLQLGPQPLSQVTSKQLRGWRDALVKGGVLPITVNRLMKSACAAFTLAAKLDRRVAANREAWRVGLEQFTGAVKARDTVLTDKQVAAVVAEAYRMSDAFGLYVQAHAETGARSSQLARCVVADLQKNRLMIPASRKGRNGGRGGHVPVPLMPALAAKLAQVARGRAGSEPLLRRSDGKPWVPANNDHREPFEQAARAASLPPGTTVYGLRHSSVARALLRGTPIKVVSDWHDTSTAMVEAHYGRFIKDHSEELIRAALIDTSPVPVPGKIVPLRS